MILTLIVIVTWILSFLSLKDVSANANVKASKSAKAREGDDERESESERQSRNVTRPTGCDMTPDDTRQADSRTGPWHAG